MPSEHLTTESLDREIACLRRLVPVAEKAGQPTLVKSLCDSLGRLIEIRQRVAIRGSKVLSLPAAQRLFDALVGTVIEAVKLYAPDASDEIMAYIVDHGRPLFDSKLARNERSEIRRLGKSD